MQVSNLMLDSNWVESWRAYLVQIYYHLKLDFFLIIPTENFEDRVPVPYETVIRYNSN